MIARQADCQSCFLCELFCPEDALFVSLFADQLEGVDLMAARQSCLLGSRRRALGWTEGTDHLHGATTASGCSGSEGGEGVWPVRISSMVIGATPIN